MDGISVRLFLDKIYMDKRPWMSLEESGSFSSQEFLILIFFNCQFLMIFGELIRFGENEIRYFGFD